MALQAPGSLSASLIQRHRDRREEVEEEEGGCLGKPKLDSRQFR